MIVKKKFLHVNEKFCHIPALVFIIIIIIVIVQGRSPLCRAMV